MTKRDQYLLKTYGLQPGQWEAMLAAQGGRCSICLKRKRRYDTDHCHETGKVRGVICHRCNSLLGHARNNEQILRSAADYLKKFNDSLEPLVPLVASKEIGV